LESADKEFDFVQLTYFQYFVQLTRSSLVSAGGKIVGQVRAERMHGGLVKLGEPSAGTNQTVFLSYDFPTL
jgi:hypothetical protein